jgi:hypothetical protein
MNIINSLNEPNKGIHSIRIFNIAVIDVLLTVFLSIIIDKKNYMIVFIILILLSIIIHSILGIKTHTNSWLL